MLCNECSCFVPLAKQCKSILKNVIDVRILDICNRHCFCCLKNTGVIFGWWCMNFAVKECTEQSWWGKKAFELNLHACAVDERELSKNSSIFFHFGWQWARRKMIECICCIFRNLNGLYELWPANREFHSPDSIQTIAYWIPMLVHLCTNFPFSTVTLEVGDGQGGLACYSPCSLKESDMTEWLNWTDSHLAYSTILSQDFIFSMC